MSVHDANYKKIKKELGVPDDEPIFVIRGKDDLAVAILTRYLNMAGQIEDEDLKPSDKWFASMRDRLGEFILFRNNNPKTVRVPN